MRKGEVVTIYENPAAEENPEGEAVLHKQLIPKMGILDGRIMEYWEVEFVELPGERYERKILGPIIEILVPEK